MPVGCEVWTLPRKQSGQDMLRLCGFRPLCAGSEDRSITWVDKLRTCTSSTIAVISPPSEIAGDCHLLVTLVFGHFWDTAILQVLGGVGVVAARRYEMLRYCSLEPMLA